jgi:transcriptional regulator
VYVGSSFAERDTAELHAWIRAWSFATLVTSAGGEPEATHLPLILDTERGGRGVLFGHVARANPVWKRFDGRAPALAVFHGPHAYVSAGWYPSTRQVPTWNYLAVHATGVPHVIEDAAKVFELLRELMRVNERALPPGARAVGAGPRELADIPFAHLDRLSRGIVAFALPIEKLEGKKKLSQNKKPAEQRAVIEGLRAAGDPHSLAIAERMEKELAVAEVER